MPRELTLEQLLAKSDAAAALADQLYREGDPIGGREAEESARYWADLCTPMLNPEEQPHADRP